MSHKILISPAVVAFYHAPAVWCGIKPSEQDWLSKSEDFFIKDVVVGEIHNIVKYRVRKDGLFVFDFSMWNKAPETEIKDFILTKGKTIPKETTEAEKLAEDRYVLRCKVLNAFLCCLSTSHTDVKKRATFIPMPVKGDAVHFALFDQNHSHRVESSLPNDPIDRYIATQTTLDISSRLIRPEVYKRTELEIEVIEYAFSLLEKVFENDFDDLYNILDLLYRAAYEFQKSQFEETLILCWAVCEKMLMHLWVEHLKERKVNKDRRKNLTGRDFKASIVIENLELLGIINNDLYDNLTRIRKSRNNWLHSLNKVSDRDASTAIRTCEEIISLSLSFRPRISIGRNVHGTYSIPLELLERYKK